MDVTAVLEALTAFVGLAAAIVGWPRRGATTSSRRATARRSSGGPTVVSDAIAGTTNGELMVNVRWADASDKPGLNTKVWSVLTEAGLRADHWRGSRRPLGEVALAEDADGQVVGAVQATFHLGYHDRFGEFADMPRPQCFVERIAVLPRLHRSRVGKLLMHETAKEAQRYRCTHLALTVDSLTSSTGRVQFFRNCGLRSLAPERGDDLFGADLETVLRSTA